MPARVNLLLVPGAYHGAWCWTPVLERLGRRPDVRARALDLPFDGYRSDVAAVRAAVRELAADGPVVVVAHSYSGIVIADAAHAATRLVFVAARLPLPGESQTRLTPDWNLPALHRATVVDETGWARMDPAAARDCLYHDCPDDLVTPALRQLRPMHSTVPGEPLDAPAWTTVPSTYVVCRRDRVVRPERQRERAALVDEAYELDCGHSPFFATPGELAALLEKQLAKAVPAPARPRPA